MSYDVSFSALRCGPIVSLKKQQHRHGLFAAPALDQEGSKVLVS